MNRKGIISLLSVGLLASSLTVGPTAHAEGNKYELVKKTIENQSENDRPLENNLVEPSSIKEFTKEAQNSLKSPKLYSAKAFSKASINSSSNDQLYEKEPNDDFDMANITYSDKIMFGQLLPLYDVDVYKITVPAPEQGYLELYGTTMGSNIDMGFAAMEKDFKDSNALDLVYVGEEPNNIKVQVYYVNKPGTYYIAVLDKDNDNDIDDNTVEDVYAIKAVFTPDIPDTDHTSPDKPAVNRVDNNDKVVTGKAEKDSTVTVNVGKNRIGYAKANSNGSFSVNIPVQKEGTQLNVTAKDSAGNVSDPTYVKVADVIAPNIPIVNKVDNNDKVVTGKAEANSTVTVKSGTKTLGSAKTSSKGAYSVNIPVQNAGTKLSVNAKDASGNTSAAATTTVVDVVAPNKPTVNKVDDNDKVVTGKAEANSTVTVNISKNRIGYAKANSKGAFSVSIPVQKKGITLNVTSKDASNNVSKPTYVTVVKH